MIASSKHSRYKRTFELVLIYGFTTPTVAVGEITALEHESGYDAVESGMLVTKAILTRGEFTGVPGHFWRDVVELECDVTHRSVTDRDVELSCLNGEHACIGTPTKTLGAGAMIAQPQFDTPLCFKD